MSITIHLGLETERRLTERARRAGLTLEQFVQQLVERETANGEQPAATEEDRLRRPVPSFEEMTGPFARAVEATGMTEEELGDFFEEALKEVRAEKQAKQDKPE